MTDPSDDFEQFDQLAEEFLTRHRRGEQPLMETYAERYPHLADKIREMFPTLLALENFGQAVVPGTIPPTRLGEFRILRLLGRGGMGSVYEAVQESLGRVVALKVLEQTATSYVERFQREARIASKLHHTNIIPVYGVGEAAGQCFYAMQAIVGQSLDGVLKQVRLLRGGGAKSDDSDASSTLTAAGPDAYPRRVAQLMQQVAEAVEYAHQQGVLHRDLKPANFMLDAQGILWVGDFGLAKAWDEHDLTETGQIVGTLRYMAPERFHGTCDERSDIYGLGAVLYEMLALRPAFDASDRLALSEQIAQGTPAKLRTLDRRIPTELEVIVHKAMHREPAARYGTAGAFAEDLSRFLADRPILAKPESGLLRLRRVVRRNPLASMLTAALFIALVAGIATSTTLAIRATRARDDANENATKAVKETERADAKTDEATRTVEALLNTLGNKLADTTDVPRVRLEMYERALKLYRRFETEPNADRAELQSKIADTLSETARLHNQLNHQAEAEAAYLESLQILSQLRVTNPTATARFHQETISYARFMSKYSRVSEGIARLRETQKALEALRAADPENEGMLLQQISLTHNLCDLLENDKAHTATSAELHQAIGNCEGFLAKHPKSLEVAKALTQSQTLLGDHHHRLRDYPKALECYEKALPELEKTALANPSKISSAQALAKCLDNYANVLLKMERDDESLQKIQRSLDIWDRFVKLFPDMPEFRADRAMTYVNMARLYQSNPKKIEEQLKLANDDFDYLIQRYPTVADYHRSRIGCIGNRAVLQLILGEPKAALPLLQICREYYQTKYPRGTKDLAEAGGAFGHLKAYGFALWQLDRFEEASQLFTEARLFANTPSDIAEVESLRLSMVIRQGKIETAIEQVEKLLEAKVFEKALALHACEVYGEAHVAEEDDAMKEVYAVKAVAQLRIAIQAGYANREFLLEGPGFRGLIDRPDFRAALKAIPTKGKKGK
jgi:serine/threonine protein kinase